MRGIGAGFGFVLCSEMPGERRTDRISQRDLEVLEFVARFGVVPREVVALRAETRRTVAATRERRLREAELVEVRPGFGDGTRVVLCTRMGLRAVLRGDLTTPVLSPGKLHHSSVVARVGAQLELAGHSVLSEREILARERAEGERVFSVERGNGSYHRPDLILLIDPPEAIEVELTDKSARRLDELMRAWRRSVAAGSSAASAISVRRKRCPMLFGRSSERAPTWRSTSSRWRAEKLSLRSVRGSCRELSADLRFSP